MKAEITPLGWRGGNFQFIARPINVGSCKGCRLKRSGDGIMLDGGKGEVPSAALTIKDGIWMCLIWGLVQDKIPADIPCSPNFNDE